MVRIDELSNYGIDRQSVQKCVDTFRNNEITITVTGEFSSGKSSFINALLGKKDLLPSGETECTPVYVDIASGPQDSMTVVKYDNQVFRCPLDQTNLNRYAKFGNGFDSNTAAVNISLKDYALNSRIHIVDCPGTNTIYSKHGQITRRVLNRSDMVIYTFNKLIGQESLNAIENIYRHNKNILFVMTHIDERDGNEYLDESVIRKYVKEASDSILHLIGKADVFTVGSLKAFTDETYIAPIRDHINSFAGLCGNNAIKESAVRKINILIDDAVSEKESELKTLRTAKGMESEKLSMEIEKAEKKLELVRKEISSAGRGIEERSHESAENLTKKIRSISEKNVTTLTSKIGRMSENDIRNILQREVDRVCEKYESDVSGAIRNAIKGIVSSEYKNASDKVAETVNGIALPVFEKMVIDPDSIDVKFREGIFDKSPFLAEIQECESEQDELSAQKQQNAEYAAERRSALDKKNSELFQERKNAAAMQYVPQMDEIRKEGGGAVGKTIGRVIGEVADIALLFINPAGGAAGAAAAGAKGAGEAAKAAGAAMNVVKVADKAKDAAKIAQYAAKVAANVSVGNAVSAAAKGAEKAPGKSGEVLGTIAKVLDYVSVGHWAEKIGEAIGNAVCPEKVHYVENEQVRENYFAQIKAQNELIAELKKSVESEEEELHRLSDMSDISRKMSELNRRKIQINQRMQEAEELQKKINEQEKLRVTAESLSDLVKESFSAHTEENCEYAREIMRSAAKLAVDSVEQDYSEKLEQAGKELSVLKRSKESLANEIVGLENMMSSYSDIRSSVDQWLSHDSTGVSNA